MRNKRTFLMVLFAMVLSVLMATGTSSAEEPGKKGAADTKFVKLVDNFIILFDSSSSMDEPYKNTNMRKIEAEKKIIKDRIGSLPELDYNVGLYTFTPKGGIVMLTKPETAFRPYYYMRPYNKKQFIKSIDNLPSRGNGPTLLNLALYKLDYMLADLSGRTVIFIFTDGKYADIGLKKKPVEIARELALKYNTCFYVISSAEGLAEKKVLKDVAAINECSQLITFDDLLEKPEFIPGALFVPKK